MEAVFGARMAVRQNQVRATIGQRAGRPPAAVRPARARSRDHLARAPKGSSSPSSRRRAHGTVRARDRAPRRDGEATAPRRSVAIDRRGRRRRRHRRDRDARRCSRAARSRRRSSSGARPPRVEQLRAGSPATRRVLLPLPVRRRVTRPFDDDARDLDPPTDVLAFDVAAAAAAPRIASTIVAPDGTRAEGYAVEEDGVARPEGDGYTFVPPPRSESERGRPGPTRPHAPVGHRPRRLHEAPLAPSSPRPPTRRCRPTRCGLSSPP